MAKTLSAGLKSHLAGETVTIAFLWRITRTDGHQFFFTSHDEDIIYDGDVYQSSSGFLATEVDQKLDLSVDNLEVMSFLIDDEITLANMKAGLFDYAIIDIFFINYESVADGVGVIAQGWVLGEVQINDNSFQTEIRSKTQLLQQNIGDMYTPICRVDLGDSKCTIDLKPDDWEAATAYALGDIVKATSYDGRRYVCTTAGTSGGGEPVWDTTIGNTTNDNTAVWTCYDAWTKQGTVTFVDPQQPKRIFTDTNIVYASDIFTGGLLTWLSGDNLGFEMEVGEFNSALCKYSMFLPMQNRIQIGDTYEVQYGCDKVFATCRDTFSNQLNFRGEDKLPGVDQVMRVPNVPT